MEEVNQSTTVISHVCSMTRSSFMDKQRKKVRGQLLLSRKMLILPSKKHPSEFHPN